MAHALASAAPLLAGGLNVLPNVHVQSGVAVDDAHIEDPSGSSSVPAVLASVFCGTARVAPNTEAVPYSAFSVEHIPLRCFIRSLCCTLMLVCVHVERFGTRVRLTPRVLSVCRHQPV